MWEALLGLLGRGAAAAEGAVESKVVGEAVGGAAKSASSDVPDLLKNMASSTAQNYVASPNKERTQSPSQKTMDRIMEMTSSGPEDHGPVSNDIEPWFGGKPPVFNQPKSNPIVDRVMNLENAKAQSGSPANDLVRQELIANLEPVLKTISMNTLKTTEELKQINEKVSKILADGGVKKFEAGQESKPSASPDDGDTPDNDTKKNGNSLIKDLLSKDPDPVSAIKKIAVGGVMMAVGAAGKYFMGDKNTDNTRSGGYGQADNKPVDLGKDVGALSEKYESGGHGVGTISSGQNDPKGGVSYGKYQLASKTGSMSAFINSKEGQPFKKDFEGLTPGTDSFNSKYREVVSKNGDKLDQAQHDFLGRTHYNVAISEAKKKGFDTGDRAIQEAIWAMAMHLGPGGAKKAIDMAAMGGIPKDKSDQLNKLYDSRTQYWQNKGSAGGAAVASRLVRERRDAQNIENGQNTQMAGTQAGTSRNGSAGLSGHGDGNGKQGNPGPAQAIASNGTSPSRINGQNTTSGNKSGVGQSLTQNSAKDAARSNPAPKVTVHAPATQVASNQTPKAPPRGVPSARPDDQSIWEKYFAFG